MLVELYHVVTRKFRPPMPKDAARALVVAYGEWDTVPVDAALVVAASRLEESHQLSFWHALIVEAAVRAGATRLLTEDLQHGQVIGGVTIENPFVGAEAG